MKIIIIIVLSAFLLAGCTDRIEGFEVRKMEQFCADHNGIAYLDRRSVTCNDGSFTVVDTRYGIGINRED